MSNSVWLGIDPGPTESAPSAWEGQAVVYGPAATMGSKRLGRNAAGRPIILDDHDARLRAWQKELGAQMRACRPPAPVDGVLEVRIVIYTARPQAHYGTGRNAGRLKAGAPRLPRAGLDIDKVMRATLDTATRAGWWTDDQRVAAAAVWRLYADGPEGVRTEVRAHVLEEP